MGSHGKWVSWETPFLGRIAVTGSQRRPNPLSFLVLVLQYSIGTHSSTRPSAISPSLSDSPFPVSKASLYKALYHLRYTGNTDQTSLDFNITKRVSESPHSPVLPLNSSPTGASYKAFFYQPVYV